jgi:hypothetical protein
MPLTAIGIFADSDIPIRAAGPNRPESRADWPPQQRPWRRSRGEADGDRRRVARNRAGGGTARRDGSDREADCRSSGSADWPEGDQTGVHGVVADGYLGRLHGEGCGSMPPRCWRPPSCAAPVLASLPTWLQWPSLCLGHGDGNETGNDSISHPCEPRTSTVDGTPSTSTRSMQLNPWRQTSSHSRENHSMGK